MQICPFAGRDGGDGGDDDDDYCYINQKYERTADGHLIKIECYDEGDDDYDDSPPETVGVRLHCQVEFLRRKLNN